MLKVTSRSSCHRCLSRHNRRIITCSSQRNEKIVWVAAESKEAFCAGLENGVTSFLFPHPGAPPEYLSLGRFQQLIVDDQARIIDRISGQQLGINCKVTTSQEVQALEKAVANGQLKGFVVLDPGEWKVIPAENLVALLQEATLHTSVNQCKLMVAVQSAEEAALMLGALEAGSHGVLLRTGSGSEVRQLCQRVSKLNSGSGEALELQSVKVTRVVQLGTGDRVCVDLASLMKPMEGLLVGSFSRGLFLVHSECEESNYISSRPFRVNAGPVHSYVNMPNGRTAYLSELCSGMEVLVADAKGHWRTALVGRVKVESRPLVLVEAVTDTGDIISLQMQNAETVKLIGSTSCTSHAVKQPLQAISVSELEVGDQVLAFVQDGARHTGIAIKEFIVEK